MLQSQPKYNIYPTLLDAFASYLNSSQVYQKYYGFTENPQISEEEFEQKKFGELIGKINRVPLEDSYAADKGTMFNEIIDCLVERRKSKQMHLVSDIENHLIVAQWKGITEGFNIHDCKTIAGALKGSVCQTFHEGFLETRYGVVRMYGFTDFLLPFRIVDLKTTSNYSAFKYRENWQHIVYPYLMHFNGNFVSDFTYLVYKWKKDGGEIFEEEYRYEEGRDLPLLVEIVEQFIEFLEANREVITDGKIFCKAS